MYATAYGYYNCGLRERARRMYLHTNNLYILCLTCEISDNLGGRAHSSHSVRN